MQHCSTWLPACAAYYHNIEAASAATDRDAAAVSHDLPSLSFPAFSPSLLPSLLFALFSLSSLLFALRTFLQPGVPGQALAGAGPAQPVDSDSACLHPGHADAA
jgi:hypothetical protein